MRLRFTGPASRQLAGVLDYIHERNPDGARNVERRLQAMMTLLLDYPHSGTVTSRPGMFRIIVSPYPYAISYRVGQDEIVIHNIRHTAHRPL